MQKILTVATCMSTAFKAGVAMMRLAALRAARVDARGRAPAPSRSKARRRTHSIVPFSRFGSEPEPSD